MSRWIIGGLRWGLASGVAGTLYLLAIGGITLSEAPWFLGSWILLGLVFGALVHWSSQESETSTPNYRVDKPRSAASSHHKRVDQQRRAGST